MTTHTRARILTTLLAVVGCAPPRSTMPDAPGLPDAVRAQLALGRLDERAGDPEAELARVRRFAIAEAARPAEPPYAARRLLSLHLVALEIARTDEEHARALARLREDEPRLLSLDSEDFGAVVFVLAVSDPLLFRTHPDATRAALERAFARRAHWGGVSGDLGPFAETLPTDLYATLYAHGLVHAPGPVEDAPARALGPRGVHALERLRSWHVSRANFAAADRAAARLLELEPGLVSLRLFRLAIARGEPLDVATQRGAYERALSTIVTPSDVQRLASVSLRLLLSVRDRADALFLLTPLLEHEDEAIRALAAAVACDRRMGTDCPSDVETEDAASTRLHYEARAPRAEADARRSCWDSAMHGFGERGESAWLDFFRCTEASPDARMEQDVFTNLRRIPLPFAPRALAWLEHMARADVPLTPGHIALRVEIALRTGEVERAQALFDVMRSLLPRALRISWALALADAAFLARDPNGPQITSLPDMEGGATWEAARSDLFDDVFAETLLTLDAQGCPVPSEARDDEAIAVRDGHLFETYRDAILSPGYGDGVPSAPTLAALARHLPSADAAYVLGVAALRTLALGEVSDARALAAQILASSPDSYVELAVRVAIARAEEDLDAVRRDARVLVGIEPTTMSFLGKYLEDATRTTTPGDEEYEEYDEYDEYDESDAAEVGTCAPRTPTRAAVTASGAPPEAVALALAVLRRDDYEEHEDNEFSLDRLLRGAARGAAADALRCIVGAANVRWLDDPRAPVFPAQERPGEPEDASAERVRLIVEACGRVPSSRHTPELLDAWASVVLRDTSASRAMLESFVRATNTSGTWLAVRARISALVRLERYGDAREAWVRGSDLRCTHADETGVLRREDLMQLAPELGALPLESDRGWGARMAILRERWDLVRAHEVTDPLWARIAHERQEGLLGRFTSHALMTVTPTRADLRILLAQNPRSLVVRILALRAQACGTRALCVRMARALVASDPTARDIVAQVASYFLSIGDVAEARRIVLFALEANPDDGELRAFLETRCGDETSAAPAPDATPCGRAIRCCEDHREEADDEAPDADWERVCAGVRTSADAGSRGEAVCTAAFETWSAMVDDGADIPASCVGP